MMTAETEPDAFVDSGGAEIATAEPVDTSSDVSGGPPPAAAFGIDRNAPDACVVTAEAEPEPEQARSSQVSIDVDDPDTPVKKAEPAPTPVVPVTTGGIPSWVKSKNFVLACVGVAIIIVIIVLVVVFTRPEPAPEVEEGPPPVAVDFSTGVSLITSYAVETKIRSRLARTKVAMKVANALDCSSIHALSLQLPLDARITSLKTVTDDNCTSEGDVQELEEARETFLEAAKGGLPGAYVEARDSFTHSVQVAIPPLGTSNVELIVEQLLKQRLDEVMFEMPVTPNEDIDSVVFDLIVEDTDGKPVEYSVDLNVPGVYEPSAAEQGNSTNVTVTSTYAEMVHIDPIHLDIPDARQYDLPKVIRGRYSPGPLPEAGLLYTDGKCFEHFFQPESLNPMPRNFVFLLDTSTSMRDYYKLVNAKAALYTFIDSLTSEDHFAIQSFGNKGTEKMWGFGPGTDGEKAEAMEFVKNDLQATSRRTNLHEAFLEGVLRAKRRADISNDNVATILVMISDGYASRGETNRSKIAEHIYDLNQEGKVKIFSLGFQDSADMQLLDAIALMNGGVSAPLRRGKDGFDKQIIDFLQSEIGSILMSDVKLKYSSEKKVFGETQTLFPVMADGYEVVVRGLIGKPDGDGDVNLKAITTASTMDGIQQWEITASPVNDSASKSSLCFQSYAHDRITQLLRLHDASDFLGNDLIKRLVTLSSTCDEEDFSKCIRAEALQLAVDANIVAKGLTAMVTVDNEKCMEHVEGNEICLDGTTPDGSSRPDDYFYDEPVAAADAAPTSGYDYGHAEEEDSSYYDGGYYYESRSGVGSPHCGWLAMLFSWVLAFMLKN